MDKFEPLKIDNQLCFPLYACAKEVIKLYKPLLAPLDLAYTQFITMMVLWEEGEMNVKDLGKKLFLDSGTLTPVLKKLESKGLITRQRSKEDERVLLVTITSEGEALREEALQVPKQMTQCFQLEEEDAKNLCGILHKILQGIANQT